MPLAPSSDVETIDALPPGLARVHDRRPASRYELTPDEGQSVRVRDLRVTNGGPGIVGLQPVPPYAIRVLEPVLPERLASSTGWCTIATHCRQ